MDLDSLLQTNDLVISRGQGVRALGRHAFDNAVKTGAVTAVFPRAFAYPWDADLPEVRRRAALVSVGGEVALSHVTAIGAAELPVPPEVGAMLHVLAHQTRHPRGVPEELIVHRTLVPVPVRLVDGLPTVALEWALATSWPLLRGADQRAPLIEAVRRRLVTPARLAEATEGTWWVRGARDWRDLVELVLSGCESELELYGYTDVFAVPGLDDFARQRTVEVDGQTYRLDVLYEEERLNVELDGRAFHASPQQWERDIRRDLAVAKLGIQTVRFSHARLNGDKDGCRTDLLAVRAARRDVLGRRAS